ncbi:abortive phage infection protein [Lysinibacillus sphaericus]
MESEIVKMLDALRNKEVEEISVEKEDFLTFRAVLVKQPDFKQFRGIAGHGGHVRYQYMDAPRS